MSAGPLLISPDRSHEVEGRLLDLNAAAAGLAQCQQLFVHGLGHVPDYLALVFVMGRADIQEERHHLGATSAELDRLARLSLNHTP